MHTRQAAEGSAMLPKGETLIYGRPVPPITCMPTAQLTTNPISVIPLPFCSLNM